MFLRRLLLLLFEVDKISLDSQKLKKMFPVIHKKSNFKQVLVTSKIKQILGSFAMY